MHTNPHTNAPYRTGALGALLDEYEKAQRELMEVVQGISPPVLLQVIDPETDDPDCRSIQTILAHVVRSGFCYAAAIRQKQGEDAEFPARVFRTDAGEFVEDLKKMFRYTEQVFADYPNLPLESNEPADKILTHWGQVYDVEQWLEHAILHVLRHRRQIERFLQLAT